MDNAAIADVLDRAADLLTPEGAWTQGAFARTARGREIGATEANATCWCALGAIKKIAGGDSATLYGEVANIARPLIAGKYEWIDSYNDAIGRTQAEVVAKLREAAVLARSTPKDAVL